MCTVTYLPINKDEFILTSNRDVPYAREKALEPKKYIESGVELYYPKDGKGGGSWIGSSAKNRSLCVLNGGFVNHISKPDYRKSRGKVVIELLKCEDIENGLNKINLTDIEPFTLIIIDWNDQLILIEFVWNGEKNYKELLTQKPHIWSSSTLYTDEIKKMRKNWFTEWQKKNNFSSENILKFHHEAGIGDKKNNVLMKRQKVGTVSITSIIKKGNQVSMIYETIED